MQIKIDPANVPVVRLRLKQVLAALKKEVLASKVEDGVLHHKEAERLLTCLLADDHICLEDK